jgi:hypothetical protein
VPSSEENALLHAALQNKPGGGDLNTEDALIATTFERLAYLPPELACSILLQALRSVSAEPLELLPGSTFVPDLWPRYWHPDGGHAEPDVVLAAGDTTLIFEVERWDRGDSQRLEKWKREVAAVRQAVPGPLILVAVAVPEGFVKLAGELDVPAASLRWEDLADAVGEARRSAQTPNIYRVLDDLLRAFQARGFSPPLPLADPTPLDLPALRAASRSLADFHRAQLTWIRAFEATIQFVSPALALSQWTPDRHGFPPERTKSPVGRWAWDFLPLLATHLVWTSGPPERGAFQVGLAITLDSGWKVGVGEPLAGGFVEVERCTSPVVASVYRMVEAADCSTWEEVWARRQAVGHEVPRDGDLHCSELGELRFGVGELQADLSELPDRAAWEKLIFAPVRKMMRRHTGRPLTYINKGRTGNTHLHRACSHCGRSYDVDECLPFVGRHPGVLVGQGSRSSGGAHATPTWDCCRRTSTAPGCIGPVLPMALEGITVEQPGWSAGGEAHEDAEAGSDQSEPSSDV